LSLFALLVPKERLELGWYPLSAWWHSTTLHSWLKLLRSWGQYTTQVVCIGVGWFNKSRTCIFTGVNFINILRVDFCTWVFSKHSCVYSLCLYSFGNQQKSCSQNVGKKFLGSVLYLKISIKTVRNIIFLQIESKISPFSSRIRCRWK